MVKKQRCKSNKKRTSFTKKFIRWINQDEDSVAYLKRMPYKKYLRTKHWRRTRTKRIAMSGYKCDECGLRTNRFEIHHKTYKRRGEEKMKDLLTLCRSCHRAKHPDKVKR